MTVVAWDGRILAADKMGNASGLKRTTTKIFRFDGGLFASAGSGSHAAHMFEWVKNGADPQSVPAFQLTDEYQTVIIIRNDRTVWLYGQSAYPFLMEDRFHAIGSGRDFALASMYLRQNAEEAVRVACRFDANCGMGIDVFEMF